MNRLRQQRAQRFRGPFQASASISRSVRFRLSERINLRFSADAFNLFNHPDFDTPSNDVSYFSGTLLPVLSVPTGDLGVIQQTIGSPRFLQLNMHLTF